MPLFIALPFASELVAALVAAVLVLLIVRRRPVRAYDHIREYAALESRIRTKANHRYTWPVRLWMNRGE